MTPFPSILTEYDSQRIRLLLQIATIPLLAPCVPFAIRLQYAP